MYTTDSHFNVETMTEYMVSGKLIMPPDSPRPLGNISSNASFSGLNLDLFNVSTSDTLSTPILDLLPTSGGLEKTV